MNLVTLLHERAALHPDRAALVETKHAKHNVISFADLAARVSAGAAFLQELGLQRGQAILVFQPVSIALYEILLAAFHAGLQVMLADPANGRAFLGRCCTRLAPAAFFGPWRAHCLRLAVPEMRGIRVNICSSAWFPGSTAWRPGNASSMPADVGADDPALVTFTSGSTGLPKAAVRTHGFLLAQHRSLSKALDFGDGEVDLITLPVFVLANLASGLTSVLAATDLSKPGFPNVAAIRAQCAAFNATRCTASPAFFEAFLNSENGLPHFKKLFTGGAPVFRDLLGRLQDALPGACVESVYGSTEAEPIAHLAAKESSGDMTAKGGGLCAGIPVGNIDVKIIKDRWGTPLGPLEDIDDLTATIGQVGEIIVAGEHVLAGYLGGIGDEVTKIHVGRRVWHRTGDAGWMDARGRLWLLGRCAEKLPAFPSPAGIPDDAINYPLAIEAGLRERFPGIRLAALSWQGGRTLVVEKRPAIAGAAAEFGIANVIFVETLPMDRRHNAKIDYPALRELLAKEGM